MLTTRLQQLAQSLPFLSQFQLFRERTTHFTYNDWQVLALSRQWLDKNESSSSNPVELLKATLSHLFYVAVKTEIEIKNTVLKTHTAQQ